MRIDTSDLLTAIDELGKEYKKLIPHDNSTPEKILTIFKQVVERAQRNHTNNLVATGPR